MAEIDSGAAAQKRAGVVLAGLLVAIIVIMAVGGDAAYLWIKALHVAAIVSWMAGLLYLPRLLVYHAEARKGSELSETLKLMERRLLNTIMQPAMALSWVLGLWLAWKSGAWTQPWLHAKAALVIGLSGLQGYLTGAVRAFAEDRNDKPARHWRIINELPALAMLAIVILVIVKPFGR